MSGNRESDERDGGVIATPVAYSPMRRAFLGALLAGIVLPKRALAQQKEFKERGKVPMKVRLSFNRRSMTATLEDNPSARDLVSMLPLDLIIDDYAHNEKITYLPRKLSEEGSRRFGNEAAGDLCYYAPWGNLALFYEGCKWSNGLIRLGRIEGSHEPLLTHGKFSMRIESIP